MRCFPAIIISIFCMLMIYMPAPSLVAGQVEGTFELKGKNEYFLDVEDLSTSKKYRVWIPDDFQGGLGSLMEGVLMLEKKKGRRYDGVFDDHAYLTGEGYSGFGKILSYEKIHESDGENKLNIKHLSGRLKAIYHAMVLGDKQYLSKGDLSTFSVLGLRHILAISGMHLMLLYEMLNKLPMGKKGRYFILLIMMGYLFSIGWPASALRAFLMMIYRQVCEKLHRPYHGRYALVTATLLVMIVFPYRLFSLGFQFSTLAIYGIYLFRLGDHHPKYLKTFCMIGGINLVLLPLQAYYFYKVPLLGWLVALLLGVLFDLLIRGLFLLPVINAINSGWICWLQDKLEPLVNFIFDALHKLSVVMEGTLVKLVIDSHHLLFVLLLLLIWLPYLYQQYVKISYGLMILVLNTSILLHMVFMPWKVHFVNVGQGDGMVMISPHHRAILLDTGYSGREVEAVLSHLGIDDIDLLLISHQHKDHVGGLEKIKENFNIKHFMTNASYQGDLPFYEAKKGMGFSVDGLVGHIILAESSGNENDQSLVVKVEYGKSSLLLMGDLEAKGEALTTVSDVEYLKVGHHGSETSSSQEFLERIRPKYAIISVGENDYGHPMPSVIKRLEDLGVKVYRTDEDGTIIVTMNK